MTTQVKAKGKPKAKLARARTILTNYIAKHGSLPERKAAMALLRKRLEVTEAQSSTYFNMIRKEVVKQPAEENKSKAA